MTSPLTAVGEEQLREILAGCEGVTPGPWEAEDDGRDYILVGRPTWSCTRRGVKGEWAIARIDELDGEPDETYANAAHIARLDPGTVKELCRLALIGLEAERSPVPEGDGLQPTYRHVKRGSEYVLIGYGKMQAEKRYRRHGMENAVDVDMAEVAIYRSATDPTEIWVRPRDEFEDGRFVALASPAPVKAEAEVVAVRWQREMAKRQGNRDLPDFSLPASAFPDYRMGGGGTLTSTQKCIRQDCDCFDSWHCSRPAIATPSSGGRRETVPTIAINKAVQAVEDLAKGYLPGGPDDMKGGFRAIISAIRALANTNPTGAE